VGEGVGKGSRVRVGKRGKVRSGKIGKGLMVGS
jgi:hypothetical protein